MRKNGSTDHLGSFFVRFRALKPDAKTYLVASSLQHSIMVLFSMFVTMFIWKVTDKDLQAVCTYDMTVFIMIPVFSVIAGWLAHRYDRINIFRLGIFLYLPVFLLLLVLNERSGDYLVPIASFLGLSEGIYWSSAHILDFDYAKGRNAGYFVGIQGFLGRISAVLTPIAAGLIIKYSGAIEVLGKYAGYVLVFLFAVIISMVRFFFSLATHPEPHKTGFDVKRVVFSGKGVPYWNLYMTYTMTASFGRTILMMAGLLLFFDKVRSEFTVGWVYSVLEIAGILIAPVMGHMITRKNRPVLFTIGSLFLLGSIFCLIPEMSVLSIVLFLVLHRLSGSFRWIPSRTLKFDLIRSIRAHRKVRIEYNIAPELAMAAGRLPALVLVMVLNYYFSGLGLDHTRILRICILILFFIPVLEFILFTLINRGVGKKGRLNREMLA